jgi:hypothetical protein
LEDFALLKGPHPLVQDPALVEPVCEAEPAFGAAAMLAEATADLLAAKTLLAEMMKRTGWLAVKTEQLVEVRSAEKAATEAVVKQV